MDMIEKKFTAREFEICGLCQKTVDIHKDEWVAIVDFIGDNHKKTGIYHRTCLNDLIEGKGKIIQEAFKKKVSGAVRGLMGSLKKQQGGNQNEGYDEKRIVEILG